MVHRATSLIVQAQLRAELRRSQQLLQAVVDHAPSAIYLKDRSGSYVLTNRAADEAFGRPREQVRGRTDAQLFPPEVAERIRGTDLQVMQRRAPLALEESLQSGDGTRTWLTLKFPLPGENGDPWAIGGISTDITERQQAQREQARLLRQTEESRQGTERALSALDAVLAAAPVGILFIDRELFVRRANREMASMAGGMLPEQMVGKRAAEFLEGPDAVEGERTVGRVMETGIPVRGRIQTLRLLGQEASELHLLQNIEPVRGAGGEVVGAVLALVDVTEQVVANQRLREALSERQRIADVFERGAACVVLSRDLDVVLVNRNQELLSNTHRDQTLGKFLWDIFPEAADETSAFSREIERVMLERVETKFEEYFTPLDRWFEVHVYPVLEGGIAIYFSDVTDRKRTEQFEERLVGIVSHDLRNPLATISVSAQSLLHRQAELPPFAATAAGRIARSTERMTDMIGQLLDFTRARLGGGIALERRRVDLCEVASAVCEELALVHPGRVRLECDRPVEGEWDPQRLAQVLSNLVSNGLKHGAPEAPVTVRVGCRGGECWVAVRNQGPPIPPEKAQALFDPFKRGETHERSGLGLGLYIARHIAVAHGGRIEVTSSAEGGTCFTVWLPV
jgi:PAS domain S-box-containing protein